MLSGTLSTRSRFLEVESGFLLTAIGRLRVRKSMWEYTRCFITSSERVRGEFQHFMLVHEYLKEDVHRGAS